MSIFSKIKNAIFGKKEEAAATPAPAPETGTPGAGNAWANAPVVEQVSIAEVDVEANLDAMPGSDTLNWRTSIVDLMKLIDIDSDYASRKELAIELGREDYSGSAEDNIWLHQRVMRELAANGGKVPAEFLD